MDLHNGKGKLLEMVEAHRVEVCEARLTANGDGYLVLANTTKKIALHCPIDKLQKVINEELPKIKAQAGIKENGNVVIQVPNAVLGAKNI